MKKKILIILVPIFIFTACDTTEIKDDYSVEKKSIPVTRVDLKKDVEENRVCAWNGAHSESEKFTALVNYMRTLPINCGDVQGPTTLVVWDTSLYSAAKEHSEDMALNDLISHKGSFKKSDIAAYDLGLNGGSTPKERAKNNGFKGSNIKENIAKIVSITGDVSDNDIISGVEKLLNTKEGCSIIMDGNVNSFGMAKSTREINGKTYIYWTQLFGARK